MSALSRCLSIASFVTLFGCQSNDASNNGAYGVGFEILTSGDLEALPKEIRIISSQEELNDLYSTFTANPQPTPVVDFEQNRVVYASIGKVPSGGFGLSIESMSLREIGGGNRAALVIALLTSVPKDGCAVNGVVTSPFLVASFGRSALAGGVVVIQEQATAAGSCP